MSMIMDEIYPGMQYEAACKVFEDVSRKSSGNLVWFNARPEREIYGMVPFLQVTAKNGVVAEILAAPDWEYYKEHGIEQTAEETEKIWDGCTAYFNSLYGNPVKEKEGKRIWETDQFKIKAILDGRIQKNLTILVEHRI